VPRQKKTALAAQLVAAQLLLPPSLADAQKASADFADFECGRINTALLNRFTSNFNSWKIEVEAGKRNNLNPPQPPLKWIPLMQTDGFTYESQSLTEYVCDPRTDIPEDRSVPDVLQAGLLDVINVPRGDTRKTGDVATGAQLIAQGSNPVEIGDPKGVWGKMERGGFMGVWRWYQRL
jgi:hypothetical protein